MVSKRLAHAGSAVAALYNCWLCSHGFKMHSYQLDHLALTKEFIFQTCFLFNRALCKGTLVFILFYARLHLLPTALWLYVETLLKRGTVVWYYLFSFVFFSRLLLNWLWWLSSLENKVQFSRNSNLENQTIEISVFTTSISCTYNVHTFMFCISFYSTLRPLGRNICLPYRKLDESFFMVCFLPCADVLHANHTSVKKNSLHSHENWPRLPEAAIYHCCL